MTEKNQPAWMTSWPPGTKSLVPLTVGTESLAAPVDLSGCGSPEPPGAKAADAAESNAEYVKRKVLETQIRIAVQSFSGLPNYRAILDEVLRLVREGTKQR